MHTQQNSIRRRKIAVSIKAIIAASLVVAPVWTMAEEAEDVTALGDLRVVDDPLRVLPNEISSTTFGFDKSILETPRSVSFISEEMIELYGLNSVEDLARVTPSVYTPARYGIQGSVDVRGVPADTYIRGMKRVTLQGNARSVLAAMDTIEVVKGPPSPIYGMGKIGGYTNFVPKSGRATMGGYLPGTQGFAQGIIGSLDRTELSAGVGGPLNVFGKQGGYYAYALLEDSESYYVATPYDQKIIQLASSVDRGIGIFRVETGINYQESLTAGALSSRVSQDFIDTGRYVRGTPLMNLDLNGNGRIGWLEMHQASPVVGRVTADNSPLQQTWAWPTDANGNYLPLDQFPQVPGIPESMYNYLVENPEADPTGLLRAQGIGGPLPISGYLPIAFVLDPRDTEYGTITKEQRRRASAHERELKANLLTAYFDLIYDENPNFTMRNQLFFDSIDQYKVSNQPLSLTQDVKVVENKFTITKKLEDLPRWVEINSLASINARRTSSYTQSGFSGDLSMSRVDITDPHWIDNFGGKTPNTTFATALDNTDLSDDGAPWAARGKTVFSVYGLGVLFDINMFDDLNLLIGGRYDHSDARNTEFAGTMNVNTGTSESPGALRTADSSANKSDSGVSWSASLSYAVTPNIRPYATLARSSLTLDGSNNRIGNSVIDAGHMGTAELTEIGIKTSGFGEKLFFSLAGYEQSRTDVSQNFDDPTLGADVTSTISKGIEAELKWVPTRGMSVALFALKQETKYSPNAGGINLIDARALGFVDVVDPETGEVIYPAEAFLYGGRSRILIPNDMQEYVVRPTNPETQLGGNISYVFPEGFGYASGLGFTFGGNYNSSVCGGRLCTIELPSVTTLNAGIYRSFGPVDLKLDVTNLTNEYFYRPRQLNASAEQLLIAMPGRRYSLTAKVNFR